MLTDATVDPYNAKAVRASAGSAVPPAGRDRRPASDGASPQLRRAGLRVLAADGARRPRPGRPRRRRVLAGPTAWIFGNEAWGLPEADRALADEVVRVPIHGRAESLNLATAAAVCLYASARAHR